MNELELLIDLLAERQADYSVVELDTQSPYREDNRMVIVFRQDGIPLDGATLCYDGTPLLISVRDKSGITASEMLELWENKML